MSLGSVAARHASNSPARTPAPTALPQSFAQSRQQNVQGYSRFRLLFDDDERETCGRNTHRHDGVSEVRRKGHAERGQHGEDAGIGGWLVEPVENPFHSSII